MHPRPLRTLEDLEAVYPAHLLDRFPVVGRGTWEDETSPDEWNSWIWQQKNRIKNMKQLRGLLETTPEEVEAFERTTSMFQMAITPYYAALMDPVDPECPVRKQSVPRLEELDILPTDMVDPLGEELDMPVPGITHRYPDRALFYTIHNCPVYCRHCTRKRKVANPSSAANRKQLELGLQYISDHPEIRDVILSGGDPLTLSNTKLDWILGELRGIPHVEIIRLGTRNLVTLPQRVDDGLLEVLGKHQPVHINTHFNHPREQTREALLAATRIALSGTTMGNQTVLLKGINDDADVMKELCHKLLLMRIRPYYIYQCDLAQGISHFRTTIDEGIAIIEKMRGWTSGLAIPQLVIDAPGGGGKVPINPDYVVKHEDGKITIRNYENRQFVYHEPAEEVPLQIVQGGSNGDRPRNARLARSG